MALASRRSGFSQLRTPLVCYLFLALLLGGGIVLEASLVLAGGGVAGSGMNLRAPPSLPEVAKSRQRCKLWMTCTGSSIPPAGRACTCHHQGGESCGRSKNTAFRKPPTSVNSGQPPPNTHAVCSMTHLHVPQGLWSPHVCGNEVPQCVVHTDAHSRRLLQTFVQNLSSFHENLDHISSRCSSGTMCSCCP